MKRFGPESGLAFDVLPEEAERFWSRVQRSESCWLWLGPVNRGGYGRFNLTRFRKSPFAAHRVAFAINNGTAPAGGVVMHTCDNPPCVNPAHLTVGTQRQNARDAIAKGRHGGRTRLGFRIPCWRCGGSRDGQPLRVRVAQYWEAVCAPCASDRSRTIASLRLHRTRSTAARRNLRVIPPSDFADLVALVGDHRARLFARYFGAYDHDAETLEAIGADVGVSRERVRQIVERVQDLLLQEYAMSESTMERAA